MCQTSGTGPLGKSIVQERPLAEERRDVGFIVQAR